MAAFNCLHEKNKKGEINQRSDTTFSSEGLRECKTEPYVINLTSVPRYFHRGTPVPSPSEKKVDEKYSPESNSLKKCQSQSLKKKDQLSICLFKTAAKKVMLDLDLNIRSSYPNLTLSCIVETLFLKSKEI